MELWILPSAGLQEQTSIKTGSRLLSPSCLVIPIPFLPCWTPIREDSSLNSSLALPCSSLPSSLPCVLPGPSRLPLPGASDPQLSQAHIPAPLLPPKSLQLPQQGLPPVPPDSLRQHGTSKLQSLRPLLPSPNPGRFPLTGTTQLTLPPPHMLSK